MWPHAEVGVQNDPIHAIVAAVQQILIESAKSIAHARYATSTPLSFKLPRRGHFFEARSAKKRRILANVPQIPGFLGVIIMRLTEASRQSFRLQPTPWGARNAACPVGNPRCTIPTSGPLVRRSRLLPGVCPSTRTFAVCFLQTSPRGDS